MPTQISPAAGAALPFGQPEKFGVRTTDADLDPYTATVVVENTGNGARRTFTSLPTPSGSDAAAPIPDGSFTPGSYRWSATATDGHGATSPACGTRTFTMT